ncbi:hypothetical protein VWV82_004529 [Cronobacter malonaticus]|uniref:hypothetical protein n=1 Tax=Cronobacter malonaticus TaxID=413503 RepID=UPI0012D42ADA|nr:hypothetical protein [Cronobacter malonaticus]EMD9271545.1 hypothetical protein [Cronobacter malonaticus]EMD9275854.1 hypothetical protein [Cronobacter malonaticus]
MYGACALSGIALQIKRVDRQQLLCGENALLSSAISREDLPRCSETTMYHQLHQENTLQKKTKPANAGLSGFLLAGNRVLSTRYNIVINEISYQLPLPKSNN